MQRIRGRVEVARDGEGRVEADVGKADEEDDSHNHVRQERSQGAVFDELHAKERTPG